MDLLIIGGTSFVGRHIVQKAIEKGHNVTLFNRGKSNPGLFPELPRITGDRRKDAQKLAGRMWDAAIDTNAYSPADLLPVMEHLQTGHFTFISTISVYDDFKQGPASESSSVFQQEIKGDKVTGETYGPLKAMCERLVKERMGEEALIIRPGIVVGPYDPTDRFTYWAKRLAEPGDILVPGSEEREVQWIDARDMAEFIVSQAERKAGGTFNLAADPIKMDEFVESVSTEECGKLHWVDDAFLEKQHIEPFNIPLWIPVSADYPQGFFTVDNAKAKSAGLTARSAKESAEAVREWLAAEGMKTLKTGLDESLEKELIRQYK